MPYINPAEVDRVKRIDLLTYLEQFEPDELVRLGANIYTTKTHDSLKLSNGKWFWWSRGFGGKSALDYLIKVKGMSFLDAASLLGAADYVEPLAPAPKSSSQPSVKELLLPPADKNNAEVINYLQRRGIDPLVIESCIQEGLIFQTRRVGVSHVVFVGYDSDGIARYASLRSISRDFKGEAEGSDKRYSFRLESQTDASSVHVVEGAIDALSFATLAQTTDVSWRSYNVLSLGGIPPVRAGQEQTRIPVALSQYFADHPKIKTVDLHLDNDEPGIRAANMIASALAPQGYSVSISPPPFGKDVNEYLMLTRAKTGAKNQDEPQAEQSFVSSNNQRKTAAYERSR